MKNQLVLVFLALAVLSCSAFQKNKWNRVPIQQVSSENFLANALSYGTEQIVKQALLINALADNNYTIKEVHNVNENIDDGYNYHFNMTLGDTHNNLMNANFIVFNQPWTNTLALQSYVFNQMVNNQAQAQWGWDEYSNQHFFNQLGPDQDQAFNLANPYPFNVQVFPFMAPDFSTINQTIIEQEGQLEQNYTSLNVAKAIKDAQIKALLEHGVEYVIQRGIKKSVLSKGDWSVVKINEIEKKDGSGINYKFDVTLEDANKNDASAIFIVELLNGSETPQVPYYNLKV